jgi:hypothetical protein
MQRVRERLAIAFRALVEAVEEGGHAPPTQAEVIQRTGTARATLSKDFRLPRKTILEFDPENPIKIQKSVLIYIEIYYPELLTCRNREEKVDFRPLCSKPTFWPIMAGLR